jgi:uncharacterized protein
VEQLAQMEQMEQLGQPVTASRTRLLVLQGTPFCNIDCDYCYLPARDDRRRMAPETVRLAARRLREDGLAGPELTVVWHAGEPLTLPRAWYEAAFAAVAEELGAATVVTHSMQTNATLVDADWCRFFVRHGVAVGVSVDGPAHLHDAHRRTRRGGGTHAAVVRGLQALQAHGVPFHAIAVVGRDTLADADVFFDWFDAHGVRRLGCNIDEAEGAHRGCSVAGHEDEHAAFLRRLLERSLASGGRLVVREFAEALQRLAAGGVEGNPQVEPLALVTVGVDGAFGTFSPEFVGQQEDWTIGNVHAGGYRAARAGERLRRLWQAVQAGVAACERTCAQFAYCRGGSPVNKLYENGRIDSTETLYCRAQIQRPFEAVLQQLEAEVQRS